MGYSDPSMAAIYRQRISDERQDTLCIQACSSAGLAPLNIIVS